MLLLTALGRKELCVAFFISFLLIDASFSDFPMEKKNKRAKTFSRFGSVFFYAVWSVITVGCRIGFYT
jgi:predicted branched-subunit amino acid permease